ncbi:DNA-processing protein DprA [Legionella spiritensis]|uniref:Protein smf n=1 Tax=Legionella spiritensis TaxID=452 RepID=A0A0W0Z681_LEGSP|nr:DNA-processing protein DprA [Legionella spiritensis]KTD64625.1 protein smf [Legionella spiritensis]SNV47478.1 protein smf [Legionella spiritensis]
MNNKPYFLALNRINGIGPRHALKLVRHWPCLGEVFARSVDELTGIGLPSKMAEAICRFDMAAIEADLAWEKTDHHHLLTWEDPRYPALLREIHDPPIALYAMGDLNAFQQPCLAMVGSRKPSITGEETARRFAFELAKHQITIVSGLALGIDAQAHTGCLAAGGKTIAVMGTGVNCVYPRRHEALARRISEQGLLISEFPLNSSPNAGHFPRRNRIISGLSLSTLIVEAAIKSGSLITARLALEQNRDVMAIPGSIHNPQARGCHFLLQQGAKLITSTADVLEEFGLSGQSEKMNTPPSSLATNNENLVKCIGFEITTVDQIAIRSGLSIEAVACDLAALEVQGIVKAVPGGYMRCA